jgi:hypothetical protein
MRHASLASSFLVFLSIALGACSSPVPGASSASPSGVSSGSLSAASTSTPALDALKRGGTFMFALDESDPAAGFRAECATSSSGDASKADACYARVRDVGSHEGIRFAFDADEHLVWTSFGIEEGKEVLYIEAPLAVATAGDHVVVGTPVATPKGIQLEGKPFPPGMSIHFEVVDDSTVVMNDPPKGRLVFHRTR